MFYYPINGNRTRRIAKSRGTNRRVNRPQGKLHLNIHQPYGLENGASSVVDVIKLFLEEIQISPKLRNGKKIVLMFEPALKCEKLFFAF